MCNRIKVWSNLCNWIIPSSAGQYTTEYCGKVHPIHNICLSAVQFCPGKWPWSTLVTICTVGCCWVHKKGDSNCMLIEVIKRLWATHGRIYSANSAERLLLLFRSRLYWAIKAATSRAARIVDSADGCAWVPTPENAPGKVSREGRGRESRQNKWIQVYFYSN